jgi:hypothetical protein
MCDMFNHGANQEVEVTYNPSTGNCYTYAGQDVHGINNYGNGDGHDDAAINIGGDGDRTTGPHPVRQNFMIFLGRGVSLAFFGIFLCEKESIF